MAKTHGHATCGPNSKKPTMSVWGPFCKSNDITRLASI